MAKVIDMRIHYILKGSMYLPKHTLDKRSNSKKNENFNIFNCRNQEQREKGKWLVLLSKISGMKMCPCLFSFIFRVLGTVDVQFVSIVSHPTFWYIGYEHLLLYDQHLLTGIEGSRHCQI
jgi:hypothetical protein